MIPPRMRRALVSICPTVLQACLCPQLARKGASTPTSSTRRRNPKKWTTVVVVNLHKPGTLEAICHSMPRGPRFPLPLLKLESLVLLVQTRFKLLLQALGRLQLPQVAMTKTLIFEICDRVKAVEAFQDRILLHPRNVQALARLVKLITGYLKYRGLGSESPCIPTLVTSRLRLLHHFLRLCRLVSASTTRARSLDITAEPGVGVKSFMDHPVATDCMGMAQQ